jgi:hypothetical protein
VSLVSDWEASCQLYAALSATLGKSSMAGAVRSNDLGNYVVYISIYIYISHYIVYNIRFKDHSTLKPKNTTSQLEHDLSQYVPSQQANCKRSFTCMMIGPLETAPGRT